MHLFIVFHTSSVMFRLGLLAGQSSTRMLCSCNHVLTFFEECAGARSCWKIMSSSPYRSSMDKGDSLTLPYTQYGVYETVDLRAVIFAYPSTGFPSILFVVGRWGRPQGTLGCTPPFNLWIHCILTEARGFMTGCPSWRQPLLVASYDTQRIRWSYSIPGNHTEIVQTSSLCICLSTEATLTSACRKQGFCCRLVAMEAHLSETTTGGCSRDFLRQSTTPLWLADKNLLVLAIWQSCLSSCGMVFFCFLRETEALLQSTWLAMSFHCFPAAWNETFSYFLQIFCAFHDCFMQ